MIKHPAYHLRKNKAVDRLIFLELIRALDLFISVSKHRYYGFGGPYLEDMRLVSEAFPQIPLWSFETDEDTYKRQKFHKCSRHIILKNMSFGEFLPELPAGVPAIVWLDYTGLGRSDLQEFQKICQLVGEWSLIRLTLRAKAPLGKQRIRTLKSWAYAKFSRRFREFIPPDVTASDFSEGGFPCFVQKMVHRAALSSLPVRTEGDHVFQLLHSSHYSDGTEMVSITGIIVSQKNQERIAGHFQANLEYTNVDWQEPSLIRVPDLTTKERLHLARFLPPGTPDGTSLAKKLRYNIGADESTTIEALTQYEKYFRYYPYFAKVLM